MSETSVPSVTVVVPVYDDYGPLEACLEALEDQSYPDDRLEIAVVDNGTPESRIPDFPERDSPVRHLNYPEGGSYAARNAGIEATDGEILAFTDADCRPEPEWLREGVRALRSPPENVGLVGGAVDLYADDPEAPTAAEFWELVSGFPQRHYIRDLHFAATANMLTFRSVVEEVGPFDHELRSGGDREWGERVYEAGYDLVYAPDAIVRHPARRTLTSLVRKRIRTTRGDYRRRERRGELSPPARALEMARRAAELAVLPVRTGLSTARSLDSSKGVCKFAAAEGLLQATKRIVALHELGGRLCDAPDRYRRSPEA